MLPHAEKSSKLAKKENGMEQIKYLLLPLLGIVVGISLTSQSGINSQLRNWLGSPFQAAFVSFLVGTVFLGSVVVIFTKWQVSKNLVTAPPWIWVGGILGSFNIAASIFLVPKLGALSLIMAIVGGQIIAAIVFDHFGIMGYPKISVTSWRLLGCLLVMAGLFLAMKK